MVIGEIFKSSQSISIILSHFFLSLISRQMWSVSLATGLGTSLNTLEALHSFLLRMMALCLPSLLILSTFSD